MPQTKNRPISPEAVQAGQAVYTATTLKLYDLVVLGIGMVTAFISALLVIRALIRYVSRHDFTVFAWYRIGFGLLILLTSWTGLVHW